jgi:hypothetical protein
LDETTDQVEAYAHLPKREETTYREGWLPDEVIRDIRSLRLTSLLALQADPVADARLPCAKRDRHHRHTASGANGRALVVHAGSMACRPRVSAGVGTIDLPVPHR